MLLEGLHIPLTTPFQPDGHLNLPKLAANVARYSKTPAAGLIVLGLSAEPTLLSDDETREVLRTAAESATPEKVLIAGISRDSVSATLALAEFAADLHYDAALVGVPSMLAAEASRFRELLTYFQTVADRAPLPILLRSVNRRSIPTEAAVELAAHPNVIGLLSGESAQSATAAIVEILARTASVQRDVTVSPVFAAVTTRMKMAAAGHTVSNLVSAATLAGTTTAIAEAPPQPALRTRTKSVGFQILAGHTPEMLHGLRAGSVGIAPTFAACVPQACYEVFAAWKDDDQALAEEKQARLREASQLAKEALGPAGLKFACDLNGYFGGLPRLPHLPLTGEQRTAVETHMKGLRN
jgi:4-hydroxy-2-oxoglutarate aldolase